MSEAMKIPVNEMKLAKFETFIQDIDAIIKRYEEKGRVQGVSDVMRRTIMEVEGLERIGNTSLALVYDYGTCNEYAKVIMDFSTIVIHQNSGDTIEVGRAISSFFGSGMSNNQHVVATWNEHYPTYDSFGDIKGKINAAKKFVELCRKTENREEGYKFIFWALMVLAVDKSDAEDHLSLICDLANMLNITDGQFEDIIWVVKTVCSGGCSMSEYKEYKFKSEAIAMFDNMLRSRFLS